MANITELQLQGDSTVHKLNDARITTTAVTTATHILTTNSGVTSIAPITAANLASVLGGEAVTGAGDANTITDLIHAIQNYNVTNAPSAIQYGVLITLRWGTAMKIQYAYGAQKGASYSRLFANNSWGDWKKNYDENILSNSTDLASLASALGGLFMSAEESYTGVADDFFPTNARSWRFEFIGSDDTKGWPLGGYAFVLSFRRTASGTSGFQIFMSSDNRMYYRAKNNNNWSTWRALFT